MPEIVPSRKEPGNERATPQSPLGHKRTAAKTAAAARGRFSPEDVFLASIIIVSLAAAVALARPLKVPPIVVATFLAIAVSTLVYRFLGGIPSNTTLVLKTIQVSGSLAALISLIILFNTNIEGWIARERQLDAALTSDEWVGIWGQTYPEKSWRGEYTFSRANPTNPNALTVSGAIWKVSENERTTILTVDGKGTVTDQGLDLDLRLVGVKGSPFDGQTLRWKNTSPLLRQRATRTVVETAYVDKDNRPQGGPQNWGLALAKME